MIKGEFKTKAGEIRIEILDGMPDQDVEITNVSPIKYEFDLLPDSPDVESVLALYQRFEFEIFQFSTERIDLYQRLQELLVGQSGVSVKLHWDDDTFDFFAQLADIKLSEIDQLVKINARVVFDGSVSVLDVFDKIENDEPGIIQRYIPDQARPSEDLDSVGILDFIEYAMKMIFLNDDDFVAESAPNGLPENYVQQNYTSFRNGVPKQRVAFLMARMDLEDFGTLDDIQGDGTRIRLEGNFRFFGGGFLDTLAAGDRITLFTNAGDPILSDILITEIVSDEEFHTAPLSATLVERPYRWGYRKRRDTSNFLALEALSELAAMEGAIFGQGFSRNFYVNRLIEKDIVEINWSEITENDIDPFFNPLGGANVTQIARKFTEAGITKNFGAENFGIWPVSSGDWEIPNIVDSRSSIKPRREISQTVNLNLAPGYPFFNQALGVDFPAGDDFFVGTYDFPQDYFEDFSPMIALCRTGLNSLKRAISSDDQGVIINFTAFEAKRIKPWNLIRLTGAPSKYQGKAFRPTSIEYDLVHDEVTVIAYELVGVDLPDIPEFQILAQGSVDVDGLSGIINKVDATGSVDSDGVVSFTVDVVSFVSAEGSVDVDGESEQQITSVSAVGETLSDGDVEFKIPKVGATATIDVDGSVNTTVN